MKITIFASGTIKSNFSYRVLQLGRSLVARGHDVSIVVPSSDKYNNFVKEKISSIDGVRIIQPIQFNTRKAELNLIPYVLHTLYIALTCKADLVYIYKPTPITIGGLLRKLIFGTPVVLDMDDLGSEVMRIEGHSLLQRKLVEWSEKMAAYFSDKMVVVSTFLYDLYKKQFPNKDIIIIPNGVDSEWFLPVKHSSGERRIVFLGALNRVNILDPLFNVLPQVLEQLPNLKILIMGDGKFLNYFKEKALQLNIHKNIEFTGWLPLATAREKLVLGDIGYNYMPDEPTVKASSNMKVPQYMARGVVPLVSAVGDLEKSVEYGEAGIVVAPNNESDLSKKIIQALTDEALIKKAQYAALIAFQKFNWSTLAEKFDNWHAGIKKNTKDAVEKNKIVYVVNISVPDDVGGGEIRNFHLLNQWTHVPNVSVEGFFITSKDIRTEQKKLEAKMPIETHVVQESPKHFTRTVKSILWNRLPPFMDIFAGSGLGDEFRNACEKKLPDVVHLEQIHAYYVIRKHIPWLKRNGVKIILDCHNIEFQAFNDSLNIFSPVKKFIGKLIVPTFKKLEVEGVRQVDCVLACSESDATFFKSYNINTYVVPNGVDVAYFEQQRESFDPVLIFMGGVGYPPNEDGMKFYLKEIHPFVKKEIPHIKFLAIGAKQKWLDDNGLSDHTVEGLGFVDDVRPYLKKASIGICPIRYGSGTRLKILTYMAALLPVVSTRKGAEGIDYVNGRDLVLQDDPVLFAESIVTLLRDKEVAQKMAHAGHDFALNQYDWNVIEEKTKKIYSTLLI